MTTISLHKYHDQINELLNDSQFSLAASHCRYILQQHPRHVNTYRLLAKTLIEQGDYSGATQLFQRVLCADPNDYIAHAGLSVVYREEDVLPQSIWHLERAYEIEPYNSAIQQELKSLYVDYAERKAKSEQTRVEIPDSLPLTKGALARLYIQGELYTQAIDVLREALDEDEDRIDLEVLLAEALWRDNQRVAAVQVCLQVLEKLPNCITANAVLAEIWLQTGRTDEAQTYLEDLQALMLMDDVYQDLDSPAGSAFQPEGAFRLPMVLEVERMDDEMSSFAEDEPVAVVAEDAVVTADTDDAYQWLEGLGDEGVVEDDDVEDASIMATDSDWLRRELEDVDEETAVSDLSPDWLEEEEDTGVGALGVMAAGAVAAGLIGDHLADDEDEKDASDSVEADELDFDWLDSDDMFADIPEEEETIFEQVEHADEAEEMPDWLADMSGDELEPVQMTPLEAASYSESHDDDTLADDDDADAEEDMYGWLEETGEIPLEEVELEAGDLDLSQFAEFGEEETDTDDDGEIVWRLTDELNSPEDGDAEQIKELGDFDFEISSDATDELDDLPDWLLGSHGTDELDAASPKELAGNEVADELAEWVAANQPEDLNEADELPDWLSDEADASEVPIPDPVVESDETLEEDDFFSSEIPSWMVDSSIDIDDSAPLDSAILAVEDSIVDDSAPLVEEDLPDWLMSGFSDLDDSGFLETGGLSDETKIDAVDEAPDLFDDVAETEEAEMLPDWLTDDDAVDFGDETEVAAQASVDDDLPDWLLGEDEAEVSEDEDDGSKTAVVGGMLGAMVVGAIANELLDDEEEDQPEAYVTDSVLENEVMEDAVSDKQDDLIDPQDESEDLDALPQEDAAEFDWLDDLDGVGVQEDPLPTNDLADDLDWMNLDADADSDDLDLDGLLGLDVEETAVAAEPDPVEMGLSEDESLDWLDALADGEPETVDEMPTWQWPEDEEIDSVLSLEDAPEPADVVVPDLAEVLAETEEEDVVEDLDDAMSWLEDLAAEPDAPVEELPSVAEDMDLDALFAEESDDALFDDFSDDSGQTETLDEIFAVDPQNDSWLDGLGDADDEPMPNFLEDEAAEDFDLDGLFDEVDGETAVSEPEPIISEATDDVGEPPEDLDDAMAWLEQLAARQGAPLDELPSVDEQPDVAETNEAEEDGLGIAEVAAGVAVGAVALGALGEAFDDDEAQEESDVASEIDELEFDADMLEPVAELSDDSVDIAEEPEIAEDILAEEDFLAMDVPEDPDEAMAWLEKLAARQGAPLDELPSVTEDEHSELVSEVIAEEDAFDLTAEAADFDDLLADADTISGLTDEDDVFADENLDDAMAWLDGLEDEVEMETAEEVAASVEDFGDLDELVFDEDLDDLVEAIEEPEPVLPETSIVDDLSEELDWLESVTVTDGEIAAYNPDEISVSDDDLADALEKLTLLTAVGTVAAKVVSKDDESISETDVDLSTDNIIDEMPEDPDEAMAWLEKLAARQGAPLDELPSVAEDEYDGLAAAGIVMADESDWVDDLVSDDTLVMDEPLQADLAEPTSAVAVEDMDVEDAMAWLEQLAARQGTSLDELPTVDESDLDQDVAAPDWVATAQEEVQEELPVIEDAVAAETVEDIVDAGTVAEEAVDLPEDMDMDDAMAWLEKLAARQGAALDELPTVEDVPETDIETPDWIATQTGPLDSDVLDMPEMSEDVLDATPDEDFFAALDTVPAIEGIETELQGQAAAEMDDIDDSLPDWLDGGEESDDTDSLGHTGWLNTLDAPDMDGWLTAEAEASVVADTSDDVMPEALDTSSLMSLGGLDDTDDLKEAPDSGDTGELRMPNDMARGSMFTTELDEAQVLADLDLGDFGAGLDQEKLESARTALAGGDIDVALSDYHNLVETGDSMHTVITDLERAAELHQDKPMVRRMLGDAYMRNGQINKAIETYRNALDQM